MMDNPEYKGDWKAKRISNPAYKGFWRRRRSQIRNSWTMMPSINTPTSAS
jgi:hypothetical protein